MNRATIRRCIAISALPALLTGCASTSPPAVRAQGAYLAESGPEGSSVVVTLLADNPNPDALPLRLVRYRVSVDGGKAFEAEQVAEATLRAMGTQEFVVRVPVPGDPQPKAYTISGEVEYLPASIIRQTIIESGLAPPTAAFSASGEISQAAPPATTRLVPFSNTKPVR